MFDVRDRVAVITGGSGVLCSAMGRALARQGAKVVLLARNEEALERAAAACKGDVAIHTCDVLDPEAVRQAAEFVTERHGRVDLLINGAGGNKKEATTGPDLSFFDIPPEALQWVFNLNILGTLIPTQVFGRMMADQREGNIINVTSMSGYRPLTRVVAYSAAKAAVVNFTQWLAVHLSQEYSTKIRVNAIAPGFFLTDQNRFLVTDKSTGELTPRGRQIIDHTPMGEFGAPEDLVGTVLWLASDASRFVHGAVVPIDGGFNAYGGV